MSINLLFATITIVAIAAGFICKYLFDNPSVDKIVEQGDVTKFNEYEGEQDSIIGKWAIIERTYKNGKVRHFYKRFW